MQRPGARAEKCNAAPGAIPFAPTRTGRQRAVPGMLRHGYFDLMRWLEEWGRGRCQLEAVGT